MPDPHRHIIQSQRYVLTIVQQQEAGAYQSRISKLQHNRMDRLLEKILTKFSQKGKVFQFDQISLDLGTVNPANFENEVAYRLEEQLTHFLQTHIDSAGKVVAGKSINLFVQQLELLEYYLLHGTLPWSSSTKDRPEEILRELLRQQNPELLDMLKKQAPRENVRKRLVFQFQDEILEEIVCLATQREGEYILDFRHNLIARQQQQNIPESNPGNFSQALWEVILAYVFVETRSYYNKKYFLKYVIRQIALKYRYTYEVLLQFFVSEMNTQRKTPAKASEFSQILQSLHAETAAQPENVSDILTEAIEIREAEMTPAALEILLSTVAYFLENGSLPNTLTVRSGTLINQQIRQFIQAHKQQAKVWFSELLLKNPQANYLLNLAKLEAKTLELIFKLTDPTPARRCRKILQQLLESIAQIKGLPDNLEKELRQQQYHLLLKAWSTDIADIGTLLDLLFLSNAGFGSLKKSTHQKLHAEMLRLFPEAVHTSIWLNKDFQSAGGKQPISSHLSQWLSSWTMLLQTRYTTQPPAAFQKFLLKEVQQIAAWLKKSEQQLLHLLQLQLENKGESNGLYNAIQVAAAQQEKSSTAHPSAQIPGITGLPETELQSCIDQLKQALDARNSDPAYEKWLIDRLSAWSKTHEIPVNVLVSQLIGKLGEWQKGVSGQAAEILVTFLRKLPPARQQKDPARNYNLDLIRYYAATGQLPWWSGQVNQRQLNRHFIEFCEIAPTEAIKFLQQSPARKHIFSLMDEPSYLKLVSCLHIPFDQRILQIFFRLEALLGKELKLLRPGISGQLYEACYTLLNQLLKQGNNLRQDAWIPVFIEEMSRQSDIAEIDLLVLIEQRLHHDRPQGIRKIISRQLLQLQSESTLPEQPTPEKENHQLYKILFEPGQISQQQAHPGQEEMFRYLQTMYALKASILPEKFKIHTIRKNMLEKLSQQNVVNLAALNFSAAEEKALQAAVNMLQHLKKYMTLTQFDNVWHHFFDAVFLKIAIDKQSSWKTADWSWMISQSMESVLYKDKAAAILVQFSNASTVRKTQSIEWKILQELHKITQKPPDPGAKRPIDPAKNPKNMPAETFATGDDIFVDGAGVVLLGPYIPMLFERLELTEGATFRNETCRTQAIHLLHFAVCGLTGAAEHELTLYKILCGAEISTPIEKDVSITPEQQQVVEDLLSHVIAQWEALKNTSIEGLRGTFLVRRGKLVREEELDRILVEHKAFDILLAKVPWSFSQLKFRWMTKLLTVEWM
jgi:hypothetical protein